MTMFVQSAGSCYTTSMNDCPHCHNGTIQTVRTKYETAYECDNCGYEPSPSQISEARRRNEQFQLDDGLRSYDP